MRITENFLKLLILGPRLFSGRLVFAGPRLKDSASVELPGVLPDLAHSKELPVYSLRGSLPHTLLT